MARHVPIGNWNIPRVVIVLDGCDLNAAFVVIFFKELRLAAFDPALATSLGYNARDDALPSDDRCCGDRSSLL